MMKLNWENALIVLAIVVLTLKFRTQIANALMRVPVLGALVA